MLLILKLVRLALWFCFGVALGQLYYYYLVEKIPLPYHIGYGICLVISIVLGVGDALSVRVRCASLLALSLCGGKPGRALLKLLVLTYVLAGPITNMCLNARDVVRVFACSARRGHELGRAQHERRARPLERALGSLRDAGAQAADGFRYVSPALRPLAGELRSARETRRLRALADAADRRRGARARSADIERRHQLMEAPDNSSKYLNDYLKKMEYRCEHQISRGAALCQMLYTDVYLRCMARTLPERDSACASVKAPGACHFIGALEQDGLCRSRRHSPKETGLRVVLAFERKYSMISSVIVCIDFLVAILFLRLFPAAVAYHDAYLTNMEHDNVYITGLFRRIDEKRRRRNKYALLPLKKMERNRYVSHGLSGLRPADKHRLAANVLKVLLETVTATTFLMLDRLFYEALWVVQRHAAADAAPAAARDVAVEVTGDGVIADIFRALVAEYSAPYPHAPRLAPARPACAPAPRPMPRHFYWKIYGGYLLNVALLCVSTFTVRLNRLICAHFYPARERRRTLHLYNRVLKQRLKLTHTLRTRALQAVRAHYLSGENLLAWRMRFPMMLGWLRILPIARMSCLICGETEPTSVSPVSDWHRCCRPRCPFVYCGECWREARELCLACDPALPNLSDIDSITDEDMLVY